MVDDVNIKTYDDLKNIKEDIKIKKIMENILLTLRKHYNNNKILSKIKNNSNSYSSNKKKNLASNSLYELPNNLNNEHNIRNLKSFIDSLLPNLNIEKNEVFKVINSLEIISSFTYLFEIDDFTDINLINEINQLLIKIVKIINKEQNKINLGDKNLNYILELLSIILLNFCLSSKVCDYIIYNTSIHENIILIIYKFSPEISTLKNLFSFVNEFMDNEDNFMSLILADFLDIGIIKSLDKYLGIKNYEIVSIILNLACKSLDYGDLFKEKNNENKNENKNNINFVQYFFDKKGFNDKLNLISSPDFKNMKCSELAKYIQENFFL